jgi:hypothetical protein
VVPQVFDTDRAEYVWARGQLRTLLSDEEFAVAARNTLNTCYTDNARVRAIWAGSPGIDAAWSGLKHMVRLADCGTTA